MFELFTQVVAGAGLPNKKQKSTSAQRVEIRKISSMQRSGKVIKSWIYDLKNLETDSGFSITKFPLQRGD